MLHLFCFWVVLEMRIPINIQTWFRLYFSLCSWENTTNPWLTESFLSDSYSFYIETCVFQTLTILNRHLLGIYKPFLTFLTRCEIILTFFCVFDIAFIKIDFRPIFLHFLNYLPQEAFKTPPTEILINEWIMLGAEQSLNLPCSSEWDQTWLLPA